MRSRLALLQDITVEYVTTMMHNAMDQAQARGKLSTEDVIFLVRKVRPLNPLV